MATLMGNEIFEMYLTLTMRGHPVSMDVAGMMECRIWPVHCCGSAYRFDINSVFECQVMSAVQGDVMGAAHSLGAVCRSWRQIARHTFFSDWWAQGKIMHALQCFSLVSACVSPWLQRCST